MANFYSKLFLLIVLLALFMLSRSIARPLDNPMKSTDLVARLKLDNESSGCWDSLVQLQACSGELIMFFLNGETNLGPGCCQAIRIISHQCSVTMIGTLGFTTEETDALEGYCDREPPNEPPVVEAANVVDAQLPLMDLVP